MNDSRKAGPQTCNDVADGNRDHVVDNVSAHRHWRAELDAKGNLQRQPAKLRAELFKYATICLLQQPEPK